MGVYLRENRRWKVDRRMLERKAKNGKSTLRRGNTVKMVYKGPSMRPVLAGAGCKIKPSSLTLKQVHPVSECGMSVGQVVYLSSKGTQ